MSRNKIEANINLFNTLIDFVKVRDSGLPIQEEIRYIKTSKPEREWLVYLKIEDVLPVLPNLILSTFEYSGKRYFVVVGWDDISVVNDDPDLLQPEPLNAGLYGALVSDLRIPVKNNAPYLEIFNEILSQNMRVEGYEGHDFNQISIYMQPVIVYEIPQDSVFRYAKLSRIGCYFLSSNYSNLVLPFKNETIGKFRNLSLSGVNNFPFENLIISIISFNWRFSFLDIYRCLEPMFSICWLHEKYVEFGSSRKLSDFLEVLEINTGWRPKEDGAIEKLINILPESVRNEVLLAKIMAVGQDDTQLLYKWYYQLRNNVVHYRTTNRPINFTEETWDYIIRASLSMVESLYDIYQGEL